MMRWMSAGWACGVVAVAAEPARSGHAAAEWLAESASVSAGQSVRTAVRLVIDRPWHTYWVNPGEAGMPTTAEWQLPDGWRAGEFSHPLPKSFRTGELAGFGHEGTVFFPVELTAPAGFAGEAVLNVTVSWLACHDDACVPGEVELALKVRSGPPSPTPAAPDVARAFEAKPTTAPEGVKLAVRGEGNEVVLTVTGNPPIDPATATVYARTPERLDPESKIVFRKSAGSWQARVAKSPHAPDPMAGLELLFVPPVPHGAFVLAQ